jgi:hypothetical protein
MNDFIKMCNEAAEKHNKRVKSIREQRLPKSCVKAIDDSIKAMSEVHDQICEGVIHGYNSLMVEDVIKLVDALEKLKNEFEYRELR